MDRFAFDDLYVRRLKEHDRETEAHFDKYFRALLFATLRRRTQFSAQEIEDVIQDVFVRVLAGLDELRDGRKLGAFVWGFYRNIVLERYRPSVMEPLQEKHENIPRESNTERDLINEETRRSVRQVLSEMGDCREAEILRAILEDLDRDEICRRFGVTPEYLRVLLHRAKKKFKAAYKRKTKR